MKGCNTGGGVAILKHPRVEVPSDFFSNNIRGEVENRQVEPGGGVEVKRRRSFNLRARGLF